jgi:uncharacterized membrane protein
VLDTINGLPVHPLIVHAVVVLLPLSALGAVAIAVRPSWRARYGNLVIIVAALTTLLIPLATSSGERLEARVGDPGRHAELGDTLIWFALPLLVVVIALVWLHRRRGVMDRSPALRLAVAALVVVIAGANLVQVFRVGESGARAVWQTTGRAVGASLGPTR